MGVVRVVSTQAIVMRLLSDNGSGSSLSLCLDVLMGEAAARMLGMVGLLLLLLMHPCRIVRILVLMGEDVMLLLRWHHVRVKTYSLVMFQTDASRRGASKKGDIAVESSSQGYEEMRHRRFELRIIWRGCESGDELQK